MGYADGCWFLFQVVAQIIPFFSRQLLRYNQAGAFDQILPSNDLALQPCVMQ